MPAKKLPKKINPVTEKRIQRVKNAFTPPHLKKKGDKQLPNIIRLKQKLV